jgi:hypothetical protein
VAVHAPVRGIDGRNQTTQNGGSTYHLTPIAIDCGTCLLVNSSSHSSSPR